MVISEERASALVERIALGDRDAESELVAIFYPPQLSLLRRRLRNQAAAEDVCQEIFIIALQRLRSGKMRDPNKVGAFLAGIAVRQAFVYARANRFGLELVGLDLDALEAQDQPPYEVLDRVAEQVTLRKIVSQLECARDRELLMRRYWLEQNGAEIQQSLKLTPVALKKAISRAKSRIRMLLTSETNVQPRSMGASS